MTVTVTTGVTPGRTRRVTLKDAAQILGISKEAVRKRVKRGTLLSEKAPDGRVYVYLDAGGDTGTDVGPDTAQGERQGAVGEPPIGDYRDALITELREEVAAWREEARRKDTIILSLSQRIPELPSSEAPPEASPETRDGHQTGAADVVNGDAPSVQESSQRRSWLHRFFFGP